MPSPGVATEVKYIGRVFYFKSTWRSEVSGPKMMRKKHKSLSPGTFIGVSQK